MTNDYLFDGLIQERLPGNIINANYRGFTTRFDNTTPTSTVANSMRAYYQQPVRRGVPDIIEVISGETGQDQTGKTQQDLDFERLVDFYANATPEEIERVVIEAKKLEQIPQSNLCNSFSDDNYFGIPFKSFCNSTVDASKRIGFFVIGFALLILGIKFFASK